MYNWLVKMYYFLVCKHHLILTYYIIKYSTLTSLLSSYLSLTSFLGWTCLLCIAIELLLNAYISRWANNCVRLCLLSSPTFPSFDSKLPVSSNIKTSMWYLVAGKNDALPWGWSQNHYWCYSCRSLHSGILYSL